MLSFILLFLFGKILDVLPNNSKVIMRPKFLLYLVEWFIGEVQKGAKEEGDPSCEVLYPSFVFGFENWHFFLVMDPPLVHLVLYQE